MTKSTTACTGFSPVIDLACTTLILGSMPSIASLTVQQYYAHPQNRFWPLMMHLLENLSPPLPAYEERLNILRRHHIALWDAITACDRTGSLDSAIRNAQGSDLSPLLSQYPNIRVICCNGAKAFQTCKRYNKPLFDRRDLIFHALPSTSPANARWHFNALIKAWSAALSATPGINLA